MEIKINKKAFSISNKYDIFINGELMYSSNKKFFKWLSEINIYKDDKQNIIYKINKNWQPIDISYTVSRYDNQIFEFSTIDFIRLHYAYIDGDDYYEIFGHKGRKYSIYRNNKQVACWDRNFVEWEKGKSYNILANNDVNPLTIIILCIIVDDTLKSKNDGNIVTFDFGNIGPQAKEFDTNWQPQ